MIDKPAGPTSHDVVQRVRRVRGTRAVGHTGTLDPFATGLLVVLLGRATRLARYVEAQPKTYLATARLGWRTETDDLTGAPLTPVTESVDLSAAAVEAALATFLGVGPQRPPRYSAKRIAAERSYRRARRGEAVDPAEVTVTVHSIELVDLRSSLATFRTTVSAGTYVRALARDLGERLGVGAHLTALRREAIGRLQVGEAAPLDALDSSTPLRPPQEVLAHLPTVVLDPAARTAVVHGRPLPAPEALEGPVLLVYEDRLVAVANAEQGRLRPAVVMEQP